MPQPAREALRPFLASWAACSLLFALVCEVTWRGLGGVLLGTNVDLQGSLWLRWALRQRLAGADEVAFHPFGYDALGEMTNFVDVLLTFPLDALLPPEVAYSLAAFAIVGANGAAARSLALALAPSSRVGHTVAAVLATLSPFGIFELQNGRPTQALLAFNLLFLAALVRHPSRPSLRHGLGMGAWLGLAGLTYWFNAYFLALIALPVLLARFRGRALITGAAGLVLAVGMVALPLGLVLSRAELQVARGMSWGQPLAASEVLSAIEGPKHLVFRFSADLAGALPSPEVPNPMGDAEPLASAFYLPVICLLLGLAALRSRAARPLLVGVLVLALLSLGPILKLDGAPLTLDSGAVIKAPFAALYRWLPGFSRLWFPYRLMGTGSLVLAAMAGPALAGLGRKGAVVAVIGVAELLLRGSLPLPAFSWCEPGYADFLVGRDGAVLNAPAGIGQTVLTHQLQHGLPIDGGVGEHLDPAPAGGQELQARLDDLRQASRGHPLADELVQQDLREASELGYRWLVLHKTHQCGTQVSEPLPTAGVVRRRMERWLGEPVFEDASAAVFELAP